MADQPDILQPESTIDPETGNPFPTPGQPEEHNFPGEYIPSTRKECDDEQDGASGGFGQPARGFPYIWYGNLNAADYPKDACEPFYHKTAKIDQLQVVTDIEVPRITGTGGGLVNITGTINEQAWKGFDIRHPNKENHRLRHICLEGPEAGVYIRGRLTGKNVIKLPEYWDGLIDPASITVTLTQIRTSQDLIVDAIEWGKIIKIKSGNAATIDCFYTIHASRIDGEPLIVEYEGQTPAEYPGGSDQFSISGWDYDRRGSDPTSEPS